MPTILGANSASGAYEISNSLRLNDDDNERLYFDPSSNDSTRTKYTFSTWVKLGNISTSQHRYFFGAGDHALIGFRKASDGDASLFVQTTAGGVNAIQTNAKFRDPSAWYHIYVKLDTTQSTASNRLKLYVNGVEETSFSVDQRSNITQDSSESDVGSSGERHNIGYSANGSGSLYDGYIADTHLLVGTVKNHTDFGETNDNGVWVPVKTSFASSDYGTNGFKFEYKQTGTSANSSGIGADTSGNDNHFTVQNLNAQNVTTDTPSNNFCTLNPLYQQGSNAFSEGNCKVVLEAGDGSKGAAGNIAPANGKWYWEVKQGSATNSSILVREASDKEDDLSYYQGNFAAYVFNNGNQNITGNTNSTYGPSYSSGDIIMVAMDMDNDRVYFGKNGSWIDGSGNADEANLSDYVPLNGVTNGLGAFANANGGATATAEFNWGNPSFSISSPQSDANGYGNFEYDVPSGYYALCTKNLAEFG
tara:strand:- start:1316 stop:2743 length:1428 start_codon:yes stop_codon:yes gene_type:complete